MSPAVLEGVRGPFRALVVSFVPEAGALTAEAWDEGETLVEGLLAGRSSKVRREVRLLIRVLDVLALLRHGHGLARLDGDRRERLLSSLQDSPVLLVRRGVWGLRTLAFLTYYGTANGRAAVGYRAAPAGWDARAIASAPGGAPDTDGEASETGWRSSP